MGISIKQINQHHSIPGHVLGLRPPFCIIPAFYRDHRGSAWRGVRFTALGSVSQSPDFGSEVARWKNGFKLFREKSFSQHGISLNAHLTRRPPAPAHLFSHPQEAFVSEQ